MGLRRFAGICSIAMIIYLDGGAQVIAGSALTLQEAVETAMKRNLTAQQGQFNMDRAGVNMNQAKWNMIPTLSGNIEHALRTGRSINNITNEYTDANFRTADYTISSNVTLFNGLRLLNTLKSGQYAYDASRMEWQWNKDQLTLQVILAYLQILSNTDQLAQAQQQAEVTQRQVERLQLMNAEGAIKPSDLSDMQGLWADNKLTIVNNQNNLDAAKLALVQLMNVPFTKTLQVERLSIDQFETNYSASPDSIYQVAIQQLSLVKAVNLRTKSAEKALSAARGGLFPSVGLGGQLYTPYSSTNQIKYYDQLSNNYNTYVGVGISIPILNNFRARNQVSLAKINLRETKFIEETRLTELKQSIERDHFNMTAALSKYNALVDQVAAYTASFQAAEVRFNAGASTSVDYLIAKNNMDRANVNLIIARYDYLLRTKILDFYQSKPLF